MTILRFPIGLIIKIMMQTSGDSVSLSVNKKCFLLLHYFPHFLPTTAILTDALDAADDDHGGLLNATAAATQRRGDIIDEHATSAIEYCTDHGLDLWTRYLEAALARSLMDRGRWDEATAALPRNVESSSSPLPRVSENGIPHRTSH